MQQPGAFLDPCTRTTLRRTARTRAGGERDRKINYWDTELDSVQRDEGIGFIKICQNISGEKLKMFWCTVGRSRQLDVPAGRSDVI